LSVYMYIIVGLLLKCARVTELRANDNYVSLIIFSASGIM
jgi:hypothetical protein